MNILGLNFGHDAGVSLVKDGVFVSHWEKERHCRVKHAIGLQAKDIEAALDYFGIRLPDVDIAAACTSQQMPIMLYDGITMEFEKKETAKAPDFNSVVEPSSGFYQRFKNNDRHEFKYFLAALDRPPDEEIKIWEARFPIFVQRRDADFFTLSTHPPVPLTRPQVHTISFTLAIGGRRIPGLVVSHHLCHACYAYSQLGRGRALIVTFDGAPGGGSFIAGGLYFGLGREVVPVYPHDFIFGFFYEGIGLSLGLGPVGAAGKLMGLAAWGRPRYYDASLIGPPRRSAGYLGVEGSYAWASMVETWARKNGIPRPSLALRDCETPPKADADIAASAQAMFTDNVLAVVDASVAIAKAARFDFDHIVLSGGCALNCPANSAVFAKYGPGIFVPPAVNDEGNSAGAALCCASLNGESIVGGSSRGPAEVAYKGKEYEVTPALVKRRAKLERIDVSDAAKYLAAEIARGAVVGLFEGKAEIGPRALGHRSLIASPLIAGNWKRVNVIKSREAWRPLAPVVLDTEFDRHFEGCPSDSYYMLFNARVRGTHLPAVTHRDGTARVQVALPECGFVYRLLEAFREVTGVGVLLNTSFNGRGEPIVETPEDALRAFEQMPIDLLYLQGLVIARRAN